MWRSKTVKREWISTFPHYELINYSEHGTLVDSVVYRIDCSERKTPALDAKLPEKNPLAKTVKEIIDKRRGIKRQLEEDKTASKMISKEHQSPRLCYCQSRELPGSSQADMPGSVINSLGITNMEIDLVQVKYEPVSDAV